MRRALPAWPVLLLACTSDIVVLAPLPGSEGGVPPLDGGLLDASSPGGDGAVPQPVRARELAAFSHTCALQADGVWCWGDNEWGAVGPFDRVPQLRPVRVLSGEFLDVCAAETHSCALRGDGTALCWGNNRRGQLGAGDFQERPGFVEVRSPRFASLACGGGSTCGITAADELYCWGYNEEGQLGQGETDGSKSDSAIPLRVGPSLRFGQVSLSEGHACGIVEGGALYCWGRNVQGQLATSSTLRQIRVPTRSDSDRRFMQVSVGQRHGCAIDLERQLYCWGDNEDQQQQPLLGVESSEPIVRLPTRVGSESSWEEVSANWFHTCARSREGALFCWGRNEEGQLGLGDMRPRAAPVRVPPGEGWTTVAAGGFYTCGGRGEGLLCWGINVRGQLGLDDTDRRYVPFPVWQR